MLALGKGIQADRDLADEFEGFLAGLLDRQLTKAPEGEAFDLALDSPLDDKGLGALSGDAKGKAFYH